MPLRGAGSVQQDFTGAAFIIAFLTVLLTLPGARREAWARRVSGLGIRWLAFPNRFPVLTSLLLALGAAALFPALFLASLSGTGISTVPYGQFILDKGLFASAVGLFFALLAAFLALGPEPACAPFQPADKDQCNLASSYPLDYFDKGALAVTDNARGCSGTPTWQLLVEGSVDETQVRTALGDLVARCPYMRMRVLPLDGTAPWASHYELKESPDFQVDDIFRVAHCENDPASLAALAREELNRPLDPFRDFPITLTLAFSAPGACRLIFRQHHLIADGRAFIGLLVDFAQFLEQARTGVRPAPEALQPLPRRGELEPLGLSGWERLRLTTSGMFWLINKALRNSLRPLTPLKQNQSLDYSGEDGTVHWVLPESAIDPWQAARKRQQVSLNSFLTGALLEANARWHEEMHLPFGRTVARLLVETRPRDGQFVSFANHLAMHEISIDLARIRGEALLKSVQREAASQRDARVPIQQLLAERLFVLPMPLGDLRRFIFEPRQLTSNIDFSNLLALPFPAMQGEGWRVSGVRVTTPVAPRTGLIVTVIRFGGSIVFNFNYKSTALSREAARALGGHFQTVLAGLSQDVPGSFWC